MSKSHSTGKKAHKKMQRGWRKPPAYRQGEGGNPSIERSMENFTKQAMSDRSEQTETGRWMKGQGGDPPMTIHARTYRLEGDNADAMKSQLQGTTTAGTPGKLVKKTEIPNSDFIRRSLHPGGNDLKQILNDSPTRDLSRWSLTPAENWEPLTGLDQQPEQTSNKMGKKAPTLCDALIRRSFDTRKWEVWDHNFVIPEKLAKARKFVLNSEMSAFLADLGWAAFDPYLEDRRVHKDSAERCNQILEGMRYLARAPHALTWIEYDNIAKMQRCIDTWQTKNNINDTPTRLGWLIEQHPTIPTAFTALECASHAVDHDTGVMLEFPQPNIIAHAWVTEDQPLPWEDIGSPVKDWRLGKVYTPPGGIQYTHVSQLTVGFPDYCSDHVGVVRNTSVREEVFKHYLKECEYSPINELAGDLRYLWALLATINDLPTDIQRVVASKGFVAKGRYRRFVDHSVIRLNVPAKEYRIVAKKAVGAAAKQRRHSVRGFWRKHWMFPGIASCSHQWVAHDDIVECSECGRRRFWIKEHERGDASLGYVLHDYAVTHDVPKTPDA
jgi:hypothetical protein